MKACRWVLALAFAAAAFAGDAGFNGKWAIAAKPPNRGAMWLEVQGADAGEVNGRFVGGVGGRSQPLLDAEIVDGVLRFRVERYFEQSQTWGKATVTARLAGDGIEGTTKREGGPEVQWSGRRPDLVDAHDDGSWKQGAPVVLFDGTDLSAWRSTEGKSGKWIVDDGVLRNQGKAPNLISNEKFSNFRLRIEFRVAPGSNSGIGLRSRYEVQILDDFGRPASIHGNGAVYSTIKPLVNASLSPESRQAYEITLIGRDVTVELNGKRIIDKQTIDGLTAMATDAREADPGPLALQGDHGPIEFYKIVMTPLSR